MKHVLITLALTALFAASCGKDDENGPVTVVSSGQPDYTSTAMQQAYFPQGSCVYIRAGYYAGYTGYTKRYDNVAGVYLVQLHHSWMTEILVPAHRLTYCN